MGCLWLIGLAGCSQAADLNAINGLRLNIRDQLEIARNPPSKPAGQLTLVCTPDSELLLVLVARVPGPRYVLDLHDTDQVSLLTDRRGREFRIKAELVAMGKLDVLATEGLSPAEARQLQSLYGVAPPSKVSFMGFHETGIYLRGSVSGTAIDAFSKRCWSTKPPSP